MTAVPPNENQSESIPLISNVTKTSTDNLELNAQVNILMEREPSTESNLRPINDKLLHPSQEIRSSGESIFHSQPLFQAIEDRTDLDANQLLECFNQFPDIDTGAYRFNLFSTELGTVTGLTFSDLKLDIPKLVKSDCFWLDIHMPQNEELRILETGLDIHMLTVEDILTSNTREKCEVFPNYYYVVVKGYIDDEDTSTIRPLPMHLLVFQKCIITFHFHENNYVDNVFKRFQAKMRYSNFINADFICYSLLDEIVDSFQPLINYIEHDTESIDDLVSVLKASDQTDMLRRLSMSRKRVMIVSRLVNNKPELIRLVLSRIKTQSHGMLYYLEDIFDHAFTMKQDLAQYDTSLTRSHSNYLAQISIEINLVSNKSNDLAAKITTIASIFLPMQVITGIWGMNIYVPGMFDGQVSYAWFAGICGSMLLLSVIGVFGLSKYFKVRF